MLETNLDDMNPEWLPEVEKQLLQAGALDVYRTGIGMKKGRQGVQLSVLTEPDRLEAMMTLLFEGTTALGIRTYEVDKHEMERTYIKLELKGPLAGYSVTVKCGYLAGKCIKAKPEYEDISNLANQLGKPVAYVAQLVHQQMEVMDWYE